MSADVLDLGDAIIDFAGYHQSRANRACHSLGLPAIAAAVLGALAHVDLGVVAGGVHLDLAMVLLAATLALDLLLNVRIALGVLALGTALYFGARWMPLPALAALYVVGWALQLVGHRLYERNAPAFTKNLVHLFVGPRYLVNRLVRALPDDVLPPLSQTSPSSSPSPSPSPSSSPSPSTSARSAPDTPAPVAR